MLCGKISYNTVEIGQNRQMKYKLTYKINGVMFINITKNIYKICQHDDLKKKLWQLQPQKCGSCESYLEEYGLK